MYRIITLGMLLCFPQVLLKAYDIEIIKKDWSAYTFYKKDLENFHDIFSLSSFVEAGTYGLAATARLAATIYPNVQTVELGLNHYQEAKSHLDKIPNTHLYLGDAVSHFETMIRNSEQRRLFWLDAHYSGGTTSGVPGYSPVIELLKEIKKHGDLEDVILIDDLFEEYSHNKGYGPLREIQQTIQGINNQNVFWNIGDMAIAYDQVVYPNITVSPLVKATTFTRLFDFSNETVDKISQLFENEKTFINADRNSNEMKVINHFQSDILNLNSCGGKHVFYVWESLSLLGDEQYELAANRFDKLMYSPFSHWRFRAYQVKALLMNNKVDEAKVFFQKDLVESFDMYRQCYEALFDHNEEMIRQLDEFFGTNSCRIERTFW